MKIPASHEALYCIISFINLTYFDAQCKTKQADGDKCSVLWM
jgi:hypothetical protein